MRKSRDPLGRSALVLTLSLVLHNPWFDRPLCAGTRANPEKVFLGDVNKYSRPAQIDGDRVFLEIPAYREIVERKLAPRDPEYYPLFQKANGIFLKALRQIARERGFDLISKLNPIEARGETIPDITAEVLAALGKKEPPPAPSVASR
jgi:hypothetical protein